MELTFISDEIQAQIGVVNCGIADVSTFFRPPAHALLAEAPPTVRPIFVKRVGAAAGDARGPWESLRGWEGGEEGGSEEMMEGTCCSVVWKWLYS